jgi:hypothetical protein
MGIPLPASLSDLRFTIEGSSVAPSMDVISFQPDLGRKIARARSTVADDDVTYGTHMTNFQYGEFIAFFKRTLKSGVEPFDMVDPDSGLIRTFEFKSPPSFTFLGAGLRKCSFDLLRHDT